MSSTIPALPPRKHGELPIVATALHGKCGIKLAIVLLLHSASLVHLPFDLQLEPPVLKESALKPRTLKQ